MNIPSFSSKLFRFDKSKNAFFGEASQLEHSAGGMGGKFWGQVYPDACDIGFAICSAKTGAEVTFVQNGCVRTEDGIRSWTFWPYRTANKHLSDVQWNKVKDTSVVVFND